MTKACSCSLAPEPQPELVIDTTKHQEGMTEHD